MSTVEPLIAFVELNHYLVPLGALNSPSELHGMLCGKLSGGARLSQEQWLLEALAFLDIITDENGVVGDSEGQGQAALARLYPVTLAQLEDSQYRFDLLLPGDEATLAQRSSALGEWCHGFLSGFGSSGLDPQQKFSAECAEALRDLAAIANIDDGLEDEEEDAETSFTEIVEYVRMAVLTLFADFGRQASDKRVLH
ncbi:MAG: UPF0149 family protein [Gammaproteobacteria bacterium]|uniref:UPF0149 family protein n=1 Tax=Pseudomaricurvus alcaniphilus TaxID=1166482 RepID=UPI00140E2ECF|nr:UPF0149 family protein [Pseudomaricurvus alcaniphilus]MBR9912237.1 UPF0149 family protein [Gammaproteobacteria bacterium]NHN38699.1 UPF0149 family protein [Pseudomaricurvus alcaniphilus]